MSNETTSRRVIDPIKLAVYILLAIVITSILGLIIKSDFDHQPNLLPYLMACSFTLLYALLNSILLVNVPDLRRYWVRSMLGYILTLIGGLICSYLLTGIQPLEASYYYQIYAVVTMAYFVFLAIMSSIKRMLTWAKKPNKRSK